MLDNIRALFKAEQGQIAMSSPALQCVSVRCMGGTSSEKGSGSLHNKEHLISTEGGQRSDG